MEKAHALVQGKLDTFIEGFFWLLPNLALGAVVLATFWGSSWVAHRSVTRMFQFRHRPDLGALLAGFVRWGMLGLGALVVATIVFPSVKPSDALATLGIGSVAIGFAFKDILQNWFAGLLILLRQPFRRGDQIVVGTYEGTVEHIEARATLIKTYDGRWVVIPNSDLYTRSVIVNTAHPKRRTDYEVGIGYADDIATAQAVILDALSRIEGVERDPAPDVVPWELDGSSVNLTVRWWTVSTRASVVKTRGRVIAAIKTALQEAQIDLPYPTQVVLLHDQTEEVDGDRSRQREGWPAGDSPPAPRRLVEVGGAARQNSGERANPARRFRSGSERSSPA